MQYQMQPIDKCGALDLLKAYTVCFKYARLLRSLLVVIGILPCLLLEDENLTCSCEDRTGALSAVYVKTEKTEVVKTASVSSPG